MSIAKVPTLTEVIDHPGWLNHGVSVVVVSITQKVSGPKAKNPGRKFWVCKVADPVGRETAELTVFGAPPNFREGDAIELTGKGIKLEDSQYGAKLSIGKDSEVSVFGQSAHHEEQQERRAHSQPAVNGALPQIAGQTVGMAVKEAIAVIREAFPGPDGLDCGHLNDPEFWLQVHNTASDIIRVSRILEAGHLAPMVAKRDGKALPPAAKGSSEPKASTPPPEPSGGRSDPPKPAQKPLPGIDGSVKHDDTDEDSVPF